MSLYVVATHNPEEDFSTGVVLGVVEAVNPEDAIAKVADAFLDDEIAQEINTVKSKFSLMKWVLEYPYKDGIVNNIVVWEVTAEYPEGNLQLESDQ